MDEVGKRGEFEQMLSRRRLVDDLVLKDPGEVVGDEDGMEACRERGIYVGARAVADHPGVAGVAGVMAGQGAVGVLMLLRQNLDGSEVGGEPGAAQLIGLLDVVSLRNHDEAVALREVGEGGLDVGEELDLLIGDGASEAFDAAMLVVGEGDVGELLEAGDERLSKAVQTITPGKDGGVLDPVEVAANLFGGVDAVIKVGDEAGNCPLKVDVVLPERVVGVDQESLLRRAAKGGGGAGTR